jgi:hypothetical protein
LKADAQISVLKLTLKIEYAPEVLHLQIHIFSALKLALRVTSLKALVMLLACVWFMDKYVWDGMGWILGDGMAQIR